MICEVGMVLFLARIFPDEAGVAARTIRSLVAAGRNLATEQERKILREGIALSEQEVADAKAVGVKERQRVRLLEVETITRPSQPQLRAACEAIDFLTPATRGLTLGHGIFIRSDCWRDRSLVVHELVHVAQYERLGGILPFLRRYLFECLTVGYSAALLELEAIAVTERVCGK
jgi:hypothetical protein